METPYEGQPVYRVWHNRIREYKYGCKYTFRGLTTIILINDDGYEEKVEEAIFLKEYAFTQKDAWKLELVQQERMIEVLNSEIRKKDEQLIAMLNRKSDLIQAHGL